METIRYVCKKRAHKLAKRGVKVYKDLHGFYWKKESDDKVFSQDYIEKLQEHIVRTLGIPKKFLTQSVPNSYLEQVMKTDEQSKRLFSGLIQEKHIALKPSYQQIPNSLLDSIPHKRLKIENDTDNNIS